MKLWWVGMMGLMVVRGVCSEGSERSLVPSWPGTTPRDLHREYGRIFRKGNRNAASHLWAEFLIERSQTMEPERFEKMFQAFCAVSGSPVVSITTQKKSFAIPCCDVLHPSLRCFARNVAKLLLPSYTTGGNGHSFV